MERPDILLMREVSEIARVDPRTLRRWIERGTFPRPLPLGRTLRWSRRDLDRWIAGEFSPEIEE